MAWLNLATKRHLRMKNVRHEEKRTICEAGDLQTVYDRAKVFICRLLG
jgi:hypothetical protein